MPILLYCVAEASTALNSALAGVGGSPVSRIEHSRLAVFVSLNSNSDAWTRLPVSDSALQFHQVLHKLFQSAAILPFRFPTIFADETELGKHMENSAGRYRDALEKYRSNVQLEVVVNAAQAPTAQASNSGTEYLRERKKRQDELSLLLARVQSAAKSAVIEWKMRRAPDGARCFARVERDSIERFKKSARTLELPAGYTARVSGPWPVTEFLDFSM
jgi:gas vesicle protein GvpL/GvpF